MKKKLLWIFGSIAAIALLATFLGPSIILAIVRQPKPADDYAFSEAFLTNYDDVRSHLQQLMEEEEHIEVDCHFCKKKYRY